MRNRKNENMKLINFLRELDLILYLIFYIYYTNYINRILTIRI